MISTIIPIAFENRFPGAPALVLFGYFVIKFAITVELCNIPDIVGDRQVGVTTLPILLGVGRTKQALYGLEVGSFVVLISAVGYDLLPVKTLAVFGISALYSVGAIHITNRDPPLSGPEVYGDAQLLFIGVLAYAIV